MSAQQLVDACRALAAAGLSPGSSGNASIREGDRILITPTGSALSRVAVDDLALLSDTGEHLSGPAPTKEWEMHLAVYRARTDAGAVVHLHSRAATAVSCLGMPGEDPLPPYTPYRLRMLGTVELVPYAVPGSAVLAASVGEAATRSASVLLANHGSILCTTDILRAVDMAEELEAAAELTLALHGRRARTLDPATAWD